MYKEKSILYRNAGADAAFPAENHCKNICLAAGTGGNTRMCGNRLVKIPGFAVM